MMLEIIFSWFSIIFKGSLHRLINIGDGFLKLKGTFVDIVVSSWRYEQLFCTFVAR